MIKGFARIILWLLWDFPGFRFVWEKLWPPVPSSSRRPPSTLILWLLGLHVALFGLASLRFENRLDRIEIRANGIYAQLGSQKWKAALSRIPRAQAMTRPTKPDFSNPWTVACSLWFCPEERDLETAEALKGIVETFKDELKGANLLGVRLEGAHLFKARLEGARLKGARLEGANLDRARLEGADLAQARLDGARLNSARLEGADFSEARLERAHLNAARLGSIRNWTPEQLATTYWDEYTSWPDGYKPPCPTSTEEQPCSG